MAVDIQVAGDNTGAIVVGDHNTVVINNAAGAIVLRESPVRVSRRAGPSGLQPRPFPNLLDRVQECDELRTSLTATPPLHCNVYGAPGAGKTVLVRHVCSDDAVAAAFQEGVLYLCADSNSVDDLLQQIFDALFETDRPFKPSQVQLRTHLAGAFALAVLDGFTGSLKDFERLSNLAATTTFALTSKSIVVGGEGRAIALDGLPIHEAVTLLGRELQRPIADADVMPARAVCAAFDGNPSDIILLAAQSRTRNLSLQELAADLRSAESPQRWLQERVLGAMPDSDRKALAAFAAVDGEPLAAEEVAGISGQGEGAKMLERLQENGLVRFDGKRYRLRGGVSAAIAASLLGLLPARAAAQYYAGASAAAQGAALTQQSGAVLAAMRHAAQASDARSVMTLAHSVGNAVALSGRWDRWREILQCALESARSANDAAGEAWALHQLGSRDLALGNAAAGQQALDAALRIRSRLGDADAIVVTEHNLRMLLAPAVPPRASPNAAGSARRVRGGVVVALLVLLAVGSVAGIAATKYRVAIARRIAALVASPIPSPQHSPSTSNVSPRPHATPRTIVPVPTTTSRNVVHVVSTARPTPSPRPLPRATTIVTARPVVVKTPIIVRTAPPRIVPPSIVSLYYRPSSSCLFYSVEHARRSTISGMSTVFYASQGCVPIQRSSVPQEHVLYAYGAAGEPAARVVVIPAKQPAPRPTVATPSPAPVAERPVIRVFAYRSAGSCLEYLISGAHRAIVPGLSRDLALPRGCLPVTQQRIAQRYGIYAFGERPPAVSSTAIVPAERSIVRLGTVYGTVFGPRYAIAGAEIEIASATFSKSVISGERGSFTLTNLPPGSYRVTVTKPGYRSATQTIAVDGLNTNVGVIHLFPNGTIIQ